MERSIPIHTLHLFPVLHDLLIDLLKSLSPEQWQQPTLAKLWTVKDVVAHLIDVNVRNIADMHGYVNPLSTSINSYSGLVDYLNDLNAVWVNAMKRVSPPLLIELMDSTGRQHIEYLHTLNPFEQAKYSVAWAGEDASLNWFHIAREYTEKWHHQQQICEAVGTGISALMIRELFYPCVETFMYALPYTYRDVFAQKGATVKVTVSGDIGGDWMIVYNGTHWSFSNIISSPYITAQITLRPDIAWKLFTKGISPQKASEQSAISGDQQLANHIFKMVAVMA